MRPKAILQWSEKAEDDRRRVLQRQTRGGAYPVCLCGPEIKGSWLMHVDDQNNRESWHELAMGVTPL